MKKYFILASLLSLSSLALATPNLVHEAQDTGDITLKVIRPVKLEVNNVDLGHVLAGKKIKAGRKAAWHIEVPEQDGNLHEFALIQYDLLFKDNDSHFGSNVANHNVGYRVNNAANGTIMDGDFKQNVGDDKQIYVKLVGGHSGHQLRALVEIVPESGYHINNNLDQRLTGRMGVLKVEGMNGGEVIPADAKADTYKGTVVATLKPAFTVDQNWE